MRLAAVVITALTAAPVAAADLTVPPPPPQVSVPQNLCLVGRPVEVFNEPRGWSSGILPEGTQVEVIDFPFSRSRDLWVRIKPPREAQYYGWVYTRHLVCL